MAKKRRSDKANYRALLVVGVLLLLAAGSANNGILAVLAVLCFLGSGIYYWKVEQQEESESDGRRPHL